MINIKGLLKNIRINPLNDCWELIKYDKTNITAIIEVLTKEIYQQHYNKNIPAGFYVCHLCENELICVNPYHLVLRETKEDISKQRFFAKIHDFSKTNECWNWNSCKNKQGYGIFSFKSRNIKAHQFSWILHFGEYKKGLHVCHKCDNPSCVNPNHLFLGTHSQNMKDKVEKGNSPKGEKNVNSKLTKNDVEQIRKIYWKNFGTKNHVSMNSLAKKYNVNRTTISNILNNKTWKHVK